MTRSRLYNCRPRLLFYMETLEAIIARVHHAREVPDCADEEEDEYVDDYSSCEEGGEGDAAPPGVVSRAQDVQDTLGAVLQRLRDVGVADEAVRFVQHAAARAPPQWRPLSGGGHMCAAFAGKRARFEVTSAAGAEESPLRTRVSGDALLLFVGALYYASFGRGDADVYSCGWTPEEVETNYSLAKRAALQLKA